MSRRYPVACLVVAAVATASLVFAKPPLADVSYFGSSVEFSPKKWGQGFMLRIAAPDGSIVDKTVKDGAPSFDLSELKGPIVDGRYKYELRLVVSPPHDRSDAPRNESGREPLIKGPMLSGSFLVSGGSIVPPSGAESRAPSVGLSTQQGGPDVTAAEIVEQLCVGPGCVPPETFSSYETIKLKEESPGIFFDDTSTGSYGTNKWSIRTYDALIITDMGTDIDPIMIEAGAPYNALFVEDSGEIGLGTSIPATELHIFSYDQPGIRLEQWSPSQAWDIEGHQELFWIEDVTHDTYPLQIQQGAPSNSIRITSDGKLGFGMDTPAYAAVLQRSGVNSAFVVERTDGATNYINATAGFGNFGTVTNHPLRLAVNGAWQMRLHEDASIVMANGASLTAGGVWANASSRALKQDIQSLSIEKATAALADLDPVEFAYKSNGERHVGFIAEDVPELVAGADRNGLSPMDIVAVLTRVVQRQQHVDQEQKKVLQEQQMLTESLKATIDQLLERISALESR